MPNSTLQHIKFCQISQYNTIYQILHYNTNDLQIHSSLFPCFLGFFFIIVAMSDVDFDWFSKTLTSSLNGVLCTTSPPEVPISSSLIKPI